MSRAPQGRGLALLLGLAAGFGCQGETPSVEVNTYIGKSYARNDPELAREAASQVFSAILDEIQAAAPTPAKVETTVTVHPPTSQDELKDLVAAIRSGPLDELSGPARRLAAAPVSLWPQIRERMLAERKAPKGDYRSLLVAIGGDVPNKYGYFALAWKKAHGHSVKLSEDWFEDLLALPRSKVSAGLLPVYRDCVLETALFRAAASVGRDPEQVAEVVEALLDAAYLHRGTFRDEVGRALVSIGDEAVPQLILASISPSARKRDRDKPEVLRAKYAEHILDKMDRLHPARATTAVRKSPRLLAAVLESYGTKRPGEAASVLLDFVDDRSPDVRTTARDALSAFVNGPAPKSAGRTVRLLGGGTGRALAYLNYRDRARIALRERLAAEAPALLEEECEVVSEEGRVDSHCEQQPARHTEAYFGWLDARRDRRQRTQIDAALANSSAQEAAESLDRLLAQGELRDPVRVAEFFATHAQTTLDAGDSAPAAALFRKASMLLRGHDDGRADALHVDALAAEAAVEGLPRAGRLMLLDRALALRPDPGLQSARDETAATPAFSVATQVDRARLFGGAGLISVVLMACGLLGGSVRRRFSR